MWPWEDGRTGALVHQDFEPTCRPPAAPSLFSISEGGEKALEGGDHSHTNASFPTLPCALPFSPRGILGRLQIALIWAAGKASILWPWGCMWWEGMWHVRYGWIAWEGAESCALGNQCGRTHTSVSHGPTMCTRVLIIRDNFAFCYVFLNKTTNYDLLVKELLTYPARVRGGGTAWWPHSLCQACETRLGDPVPRFGGSVVREQEILSQGNSPECLGMRKGLVLEVWRLVTSVVADRWKYANTERPMGVEPTRRLRAEPRCRIRIQARRASRDAGRGHASPKPSV